MPVTINGTSGITDADGGTVFSTADIASQAQAEAGTDNTTVMTPLRVEQHTAANDLGWGQTWQNVSGSRTAGTSYQNTTGRPILVNTHGAATTSIQYFQVSPDGSTWTNIAGLHPTTSTNASFIVPPGGYYRFNGTFSALNVWMELR